MKEISDTRKAEIASFSKAVRAAGTKLAPHGKDAERIRALARHLQAGEAAVKKWWYEQGAPRGGSAVAILAQLARLISTQDGPIEFDAGEI
jgi:hypothetical protein